MAGRRCCGIDAVPGRGNIFAPAQRAAAGPGQTAAVSEDEVAILAAGWVQNESAGLITGDGFHNMFEMIFDLPLGNPEHLRELVRGQTGAGQEFDHALAGSPIWVQHVAS